MTFENEFFEMAQALEENSEMIRIDNKLPDAQVTKHILILNVFVLKTLVYRNVHYHI